MCLLLLLLRPVDLLLSDARAAVRLHLGVRRYRPPAPELPPPLEVPPGTEVNEGGEHDGAKHDQEGQDSPLVPARPLVVAASDGQERKQC